MSPRSRLYRRVVPVAALVGSALLLVGSGVGGIDGAAQAATGGPVNTSSARVVRTDLAVTEQVTGAIGYDGSFAVLNPGGAGAQAVTQAQQALAAAQAAQAADRVGASDSAASSGQAAAAGSAAVAAAQATLDRDAATESADCGTGGASSACAQDASKVAQDQAQLAQQQQALASAQLGATRGAHQDQAKLAADATAIANAQLALTNVLRVAVNPGATYTSLPAPGQVVTQGQTLYAIDGKPVSLFYGSTVMWQDLRLGMDDGADVGELTANLIALGFGGALAPSNHFSAGTAAAVARWQSSLGLAATGVVRLGELQFAPGPVRISALHVLVGGSVTPGPVLDATTTARVVTVALGVDKEYLVHAGDAVQVVLPDGKTTTSGHIRDISTVATAPSGNGGGGGGGGSGTPTVNVTIVLDHPSETGKLDQAPVSVNITDQSVQGVLAAPINALVALAEGGDAVTVVTADGSRHLVAVQTGLFSNTLVQISGPGITDGTLVEVPAS